MSFVNTSRLKVVVPHYSDAIMVTMASQITSLTIVCSFVYSGDNQRKHQGSASLAFVWGIHRWPVNSKHKGPGLGVTKPISSDPLISPIFQHCQNTGYLLNIIFIFDRCCRTSAAVTPVKYECDANNLTGTFAISKILLTEKLTNGALVTPTPVMRKMFPFDDVIMIVDQHQFQYPITRDIVRWSWSRGIGSLYCRITFIFGIRLGCIMITVLFRVLTIWKALSWDVSCETSFTLSSLRWRHNDHDGVSNHQSHGCLLNRLFTRRSKKTSKLRVTGLCVTGEFPAQRASYAENASIWWRHHVLILSYMEFRTALLENHDWDPFH